jgi:hypothetical protein
VAAVVDQNKQNQTQPQSQGLGMGQAPQQKQPAAKGTAPSSGQFQNFQNYQQANVRAGERIGNLLASNVGQQQQSVQASAEAAKKGMQTGAEAEKTRIQQGLENIRSANVSGDYSQFFNKEQAPTFGIQSQQGYNPVTANLADWAQNLSTGQTNLPQLQQQAQASQNLAGRQQQELQRRQEALGTEAGRFQMLRDILGKSGSYSNPAQRLDQALFQTNTKQLSDVQNKAMQQVASGQKTIEEAQADIQTAAQQLQEQSQSAKQQLFGTDQEEGLLKKGMTSFEERLTTAQKEAQEKRKSEVEDITKQFTENEFSEDVAGQLGIKEGTTLFNILKDQANRDKYLQTTKPEDITKADAVDLGKLEQYSALQKMMGIDPTQFQYQKTGKIDPSYTLQGEQFQKDLRDLYEQRAKQAESDVLTGHGQTNYISGYTLVNPFHLRTDRTNVDSYKQAAVNQLIDAANIREQAKTLGTVSTPTGDLQAQQGVTLDPESANRFKLGAQGVAKAITGAVTSGGNPLGFIPGLLDVGKSAIAGLASQLNLFGMGGRGQAMQDAERNAISDLQQQWQNYVQNQGFQDTAKIRQALQGKVGANIPTGLMG